MACEISKKAKPIPTSNQWQFCTNISNEHASYALISFCFLLGRAYTRPGLVMGMAIHFLIFTAKSIRKLHIESLNFDFLRFGP